LQKAGCDWPQIQEMSTAVQRCGRSSIDAFRGARTDLADVGKAAIAAILIPFEGDAALYGFPKDDSQNIYRYIFSRLSDRIKDPMEFGAHRLSVITYNYDRSFDTTCARRYERALDSPLRMQLLSQTIPVVHVHGKMGDLPLLGSDPNFIRGYSPECTAEAIRISAWRIRVINDDDVDGGDEYQRARELLKQAEMVCFLGFATTLRTSSVYTSANGASTYPCAIPRAD
jgi:hypothetical protein